MIDYGDAPVVPADPLRSHAAIEATVGEVADAGAIPIVLGGDHSIAEPDVRACARRHGPLGLIHFDAHTDTASRLWGVEVNHGTPMYRLVEQGHVDPSRYAQVGLRGYWPGEEEFAWQRERGITALPMRAVHERGIADVLAEAIATVGPGPAFATIDIDVLDPAFAPGTGTPEPGGMTTADLLWACRELAAGLELVGADVVEVMPDGRPSGHHRARRLADRARAAHRDRPAARLNAAPGPDSDHGSLSSAAAWLPIAPPSRPSREPSSARARAAACAARAWCPASSTATARRRARSRSASATCATCSSTAAP